MPEFKNREEYEKWKAERLRQSQLGKQSEQVETETPPPAPKQSRLSPPRNELTDIGELLAQSWAQFKSRIGVLLPLQLIAIGLLLICIAATMGIGTFFVLLLPPYKTPIFIVAATIGFTIGLTAMFWPITALVFAVADSSLNISAALAAGWRKLWAFLWLFSILGYVVAGGYLLFIIPGVIFTIWFIFAQFILVTDDIGGMNALLKSKAYVKDRWFDVLIRFLVLWAISTGIGLIPLLGIILSFLFAPFSMIYSFLIFQDLKALTPEPLDYPNTSGEKFKWIGLATLGYIVLPLIIIAIVGAACMIPLLLLKGMTIPPQPQKFF